MLINNVNTVLGCPKRGEMRTGVSRRQNNLRQTYWDKFERQNKKCSHGYQIPTEGKAGPQSQANEACILRK